MCKADCDFPVRVKVRQGMVRCLMWPNTRDIVRFRAGDGRCRGWMPRLVVCALCICVVPALCWVVLASAKGSDPEVRPGLRNLIRVRTKRNGLHRRR